MGERNIQKFSTVDYAYVTKRDKRKVQTIEERGPQQNLNFNRKTPSYMDLRQKLRQIEKTRMHRNISEAPQLRVTYSAAAITGGAQRLNSQEFK